MNDGFEAVYRKMRDASQEELSTMLSESTYKKAILQLIGDDMPIYELGLSSNTVSKLQRSGIGTLDILINYYDSTWDSAPSYLNEVSEKLRSYIVGLLSYVVADTDEEKRKGEQTDIPQDGVDSGDTDTDDGYIDDLAFVKHPGLRKDIAYCLSHDKSVDELGSINRDDPEVNYFETVILDQESGNDQKQIKMLELSIQHGEEQRVEYSLIDLTVGAYHDIVETKLLSGSR